MSAITPPPQLPSLPPWRWPQWGWLCLMWLSAALFAAYIIAHYTPALFTGEWQQWNAMLPALYSPNAPVATTAIGLHFLGGALLLLIGPLQLISAVRRRYPRLHRALGRLYIAAALITGVGGLGYIVLQGCVGGIWMDLAFGLFGLMTIGCAIETIRHAVARRLEQHRRWALRLFALELGPWLYRIDYGFWFVAAHGAGHRHSWDGPFDYVMLLFFYVPNLILCEIYLRRRHWLTALRQRPWLYWPLSGAALLIFGTGAFIMTTGWWLPALTGYRPPHP